MAMGKSPRLARRGHCRNGYANPLDTRAGNIRLSRNTDMATAQKSAVKANKAPAATPARKATSVAATQQAHKDIRAHEIVLSSNIQNAAGIMPWSKFAGEVDLADLIEDLGGQTKQLQAGDMSSVEAMLYGQAKVLETMFISLARRAASNDDLKAFQVNLSLAFKAQAQCRATLEALAEIKNPRPVSFMRQANVTTGAQQVNNTYASVMQAQQGHTGITSPAENFQKAPNKLLETDHGHFLDTRAQGAPSRADPPVEAVGQFHRTDIV